MELDKRVRNYYVPPSLQVPGFGGSSGYTLGSVSMGGGGTGQDAPTMGLTMQRHIILAIKEVSEYMRIVLFHSRNEELILIRMPSTTQLFFTCIAVSSLKR
jgi:hypothetical protein